MHHAPWLDAAVRKVADESEIILLLHPAVGGADGNDLPARLNCHVPSDVLRKLRVELEIRYDLTGTVEARIKFERSGDGRVQGKQKSDDAD
jgi:hypothetical protein